MTDRSRISFTSALLLYASIEAGCYGFVPHWMAPLLEWGAAALVLVGASSAPATPWPSALRLALPLLGVLLRHAAGVDAFGALGLLAALALSGEDLPHGERRKIAIECVIALFALRTLLATPVGFYVEESVARALSRTAGLALPGGTSLGSTFSGARASLCAAVVALASLRLTLARALATSVALAVGAVIASIAVDAAARAIPSFGSTAKWLPGALVAAELPWLATAIVVGLGALAIALSPARAERGPRSTSAVLAPVAILVLVSVPGVPPPPSRAVYLFQPGYSNWEAPSPEFTTTGSYSAGMLGTLPSFCRALGLEAELGSDLSDANLARFDTLVFINQQDDLPAGELEGVERWLERGGRLIVIGDHTFFIKHDPRPAEIYLNQPLREAHVAFPNNSADYLVHAFRDSTVTYGLGATASCVAGTPLGSAIGAGLDVHWPARPLVVGRYGFEDLGVDQPVGGYIGDLTWNRGERIGDVVLAAEEQRGAGWLLAVGDTTGATNIGRWFTWRDWSAVLTGSYAERRWLYFLTGAALLAAAAWLALHGTTALRAATGGIALTAVVGVAAWLGRRELALDAPFVDPSRSIGILEAAVRPDGRGGTWQFEGRLAQANNLQRSGFLPLFADTNAGPVLEEASVLLVTAPRVDAGAGWAERVVDWVRRGGHLVIACSYADSLHIQGLLDRIGARPLAKLVGPIIADLGEFDGRHESIDLAEPWKLAFEVEGWKRLVFRDDDVVVATRTLGRGRVTFFADSSFLTNEYLEHKDGANLVNLRALKLVLNGTWWKAREI